jgi:glycerol-3-phosphate O-acyltransferase
VSLELFKPALRLAEHRGLLATGPEAAKRRSEFQDEMRETVRRVQVLAALRHRDRS